MKEYTKLSIRSRDAEFKRRATANYMREVQAGRIPTTRRVAVLTVFGGADSFHVEYQQALRQQYGHTQHPLKAGQRNEARPTALRTIHIADRVAEHLQQNPQHSVAHALRTVLARGRAPRFYMTVEHAMQLINRYKIIDIVAKTMAYNMKERCV